MSTQSIILQLVYFNHFILIKFKDMCHFSFECVSFIAAITVTVIVLLR